MDRVRPGVTQRPPKPGNEPAQEVFAVNDETSIAFLTCYSLTSRAQ